MTTFEELVITGLMMVGLFGVVLPVLPGLLLIGALAGFWAWDVGSWQAWTTFAVMVVLLVAGTWFKYRLPQRELHESRVASQTWVIAIVFGLVGMFVVPVVGAVLGFVAGTFVGEWRVRGDRPAAWASTKRLLGGIGRGIAIEFTAGAMAITTFVLAAFFIL